MPCLNVCDRLVLILTPAYFQFSCVCIQACFSMTPDDWIYCFLLLGSLFSSVCARKIPHGWARQSACALLGILIAAIVCGYFIWHSLMLTFGFLLLSCVIPKSFIHIASFIWSFGYLAFFRSAHHFGFLKPSPHSNAVQLLMTLRLIGVAFEMVDSNRWKKMSKKEGDDDSKDQRLKFIREGIEPSLVDLFAYSYCFIGLLTGPYYKYRTYHDMICRKDMYNIPLWGPLREKLTLAALFGLAYLLSSQVIKLEMIRHQCYGFWYNAGFMCAMFMVFRFRMYTAWILAESCCVASSLGAYPAKMKPRSGHGPTHWEETTDEQEKSISTQSTSEEYNFECIHNISVYGCEWKCTVRDGMKSWNRSVQYWLANFIYQRVPMRSLRTSVTMLVSAYWHGLHPGYYLSFLTIPLALAAEGALRSLLTSPKAPWTRWTARCYIFLAWFFKMRVFDYCCMGFLLLDYESTMQFWSCIYFVVHVVSVVILLVYFLLHKVCHVC